MIKKFLFLVLMFTLIIPFDKTSAADVVRDITFPVNGPSSFQNDFGDPRGTSRTHEGIDIVAAKMTELVSAVDGKITSASTNEPSYGFNISISDSAGYSYRYLHVNNDNPGTDDGNGGARYAFAPGIRRGVSVKKGQHIGWVGDSGNAENTIPHLHFEIRKNRVPINPYPSLVAAAQESRFSASIKIGSAPAVIHATDDIPEENTEYYFTQDLSLGSFGEDVTQLQLRLASFGLFNTTPTGYFGPITQTSVMKYQAAGGLPATGVVGPLTRAALNNDITPSFSPLEPKVVEQNLFVGTSGEPVRQLQIRLKTLGFFTVDITGYFGPVTKDAVIKFQNSKGITPTGVVELITRGYLNGCLTYSGYSTLTGESCSVLLPDGCTTHSGFSITTGKLCGTTLLPGCTSNTGYSVTTGQSCWNI